MFAWAIVLSRIALAEQASALDALLALLRPMESFSARFVQTVFDRDGTEIERSAGHVLAARGNRFRWETETPWPQTLVSDGKTLWQYDPELDQAVSRQLDVESQPTPGLLFSGDVDAILSAYEIEQTRAADGIHRFKLQPLSENSLFTLMELDFSDNSPSELRFTDRFGQRTRLQFFETKQNIEYTPDAFVFELPDGVDLFNETESLR